MGLNQSQVLLQATTELLDEVDTLSISDTFGIGGCDACWDKAAAKYLILAVFGCDTSSLTYAQKQCLLSNITQTCP